MTPEVLRRLWGAHSNGIVANNPHDGHHRCPEPAAPQPSPAVSDGVNRGETSASAKQALLDMNEVD